MNTSLSNNIRANQTRDLFCYDHRPIIVYTDIRPLIDYKDLKPIIVLKGILLFNNFFIRLDPFPYAELVQSHANKVGGQCSFCDDMHRNGIPAHFPSYKK